MSNIYQAICGVMAELPAIAKGKTNKQQGFLYRGIDDVMNALQPIMVKHGMFLVPDVLETRREERVTKMGGNLIFTQARVRYTFYAEDGSSIQATVIGEGMDSADKSSNKALAVAMKYACFQVFCIPTEEMKDPDAETPPPSAPTGNAPKKPLAERVNDAADAGAAERAESKRRKAAWNKLKTDYDVEDAALNNMRAELIECGHAADKPSSQLSAAEFDALVSKMREKLVEYGYEATA